MTRPPATVEDATLIKLTLEGQTDCFTILIERHLVAVRRCITAMIDVTDAEDVLQDVLLKVWCHLSTFRSESSFRTWMTRVAINEVLQLYRRKQRPPAYQSIDDLDGYASSSESPHQSFARLQTAEALHFAVARLPDKYRHVLILRDFQELSVRETARLLRTTIPATKSRLFQARLMLCSALERSTVWEARAVSDPRTQRHAIDRVFNECVQRSAVDTASKGVYEDLNVR